MIEKLPLDDNFVCLDSQTGSLTIANSVGARIHELLDQGLPVSDITKTLVAEYAAPEELIAADVRTFLQELENTPTRQLKPDQNHEPDTSYRPNRACVNVGSIVCYLPTVRIHIQCESPEVLSQLTPFFGLTSAVVQQDNDLTLRIFKVGTNYPIVFNGESLDIGSSVQETALMCVGVINTVAASIEPHAFTLHAAAVSLNGDGILFPAKGGSGKSTLSAYLTGHGYKLINDDSVHLAPCAEAGTGVQISPLPSPLSIKSGSWPVLAEHLPELSDACTYTFGSKAIKLVPVADSWISLESVPCRTVISPHYMPNAACSVQTISASEALEKLIYSGCFMKQPVARETLGAFVEWLSTARHYQLIYSDLAEAEKAIRQVVES